MKDVWMVDVDGDELRALWLQWFMCFQLISGAMICWTSEYQTVRLQTVSWYENTHWVGSGWTKTDLRHWRSRLRHLTFRNCSKANFFSKASSYIVAAILALTKIKLSPRNGFCRDIPSLKFLIKKTFYWGKKTRTILSIPLVCLRSPVLLKELNIERVGAGPRLIRRLLYFEVIQIRTSFLNRSFYWSPFKTTFKSEGKPKIHLM